MVIAQAGRHTVVLGIVPARGGSKSVPRKNIRPLRGKPLIAYTIESARAAMRLSRLIVSTDDEAIASAARAFGAEVPFLRPPELAADDTLDQPVFLHALRWLAEHEGYAPDYVAVLRPTSPLRQPEHIDGAIEVALATGADVVKSVTVTGVHPYKTWRIESGRLRPFVPSALWDRRGPDVPRQELPTVYWQDGVVDIVAVRLILDPPPSFADVFFAPYVMDQRYSVDLDTEEDFERAEVIMELIERRLVPAAPSNFAHRGAAQ